jgi:ADP-ribosyl-[dinitrogen reductase] hydrolase
VGGGRNTDTVTSIAGALIGGLDGASAVPAVWRRKLHGWPGLRARDLVRLGLMTVYGGHPDFVGWPSAARMDYSANKDRFVLARDPHDEGLWLGGADTPKNLTDGVNAVMSLCRLGTAQVPARGWLPPTASGCG